MNQEELLRQRYIVDLAKKEDIAREMGYSIHNVDRLLRKYNLKRGKAIQIGAKPWNFGLTKNTDERVKIISEKRMGELNPRFGETPWNKGLSMNTNESLKESSRKLTGRVMPDYAIEKMRDAKLGLRGGEANNYKRGFYVNHAGYSVSTTSDGRVYTHRLVVQDKIGRKLTKLECVHHIDGAKMNNALSNLIVVSNSTHKLIHRHCFPSTKNELVAWLISNNYEFMEIT